MMISALTLRATETFVLGAAVMELLQDLPNSEFKTFLENSKSFARRNGMRGLRKTVHQRKRLDETSESISWIRNKRHWP
jgi:hypothetical protein